MSKQATIAAVLLSLVIQSPLGALGLGAYLPVPSAKKAEKLLATADKASRSIEARRAELRKAQLAAESDMLEAFEVLAASKGGQGAWASPDGSLKASEASTAFSSARSRAKAVALALAGYEPAEGPSSGLGDFLAVRDSASSSIATLVLASKIKQKPAQGLDSALSSGTKDGTLFPAIAEIDAQLRKTGAAGAREAAACSARRGAEEVALSMVAAKPRLLALVPGLESGLSRLELELRAYKAWIAAAPYAAYVGDSASITDVERSTLSAGVSALVSLGHRRASSIVEVMAAGDGRASAAAEAALRLSEAWARSPASRRRQLAYRCGLSESVLASFCLGLSPLEPSPRRVQASDPIGIMEALGGLASAIAEEEANPKVVPGPEPALVFLERPELALAAKGEARYTSLYAEASRRLGSLYAQAADIASSSLETLAAVTKAAQAALGSAPTSLVVRGIDLSLPPEESGRRIAFVATASDASGSSISIPVESSDAAEAYARAFSRAAGLSSPSLDGIQDRLATLLKTYGQWLVCAYDPEGADDGLVKSVFPKDGGPARLGAVKLELSLLGGWRS